jgi:hypothetical protein
MEEGEWVKEEKRRKEQEKEGCCISVLERRPAVIHTLLHAQQFILSVFMFSRSALYVD